MANVTKSVCGAALALLCLASAAVSQTADEAAAPSGLTPEAEMNLALSAAPEAVARGATVWVLGPNGFEVARQGTNGYSCMVDRGDSGDALIPICHNAEGSETRMKVEIARHAMRLEGAASEELDRLIAEGYRSGRFRPARPGGISYMLSDQAFGVDSTGSRFAIPPHIMVYSPYATSEDLGYSSDQIREMSKAGLPWILNEGTPDAWIIIWRRN